MRVCIIGAIVLAEALGAICCFPKTAFAVSGSNYCCQGPEWLRCLGCVPWIYPPDVTKKVWLDIPITETWICWSYDSPVYCDDDQKQECYRFTTNYNLYSDVFCTVPFDLLPPELIVSVSQCTYDDGCD